jgi:class 3 adenylate cyclase
MADREVQRRLAAIVAADVTGYTRLMEADEEGTVAAWHAARSEIIDPQITDHLGRIVKHTGDGFLAEFPTVQDAVKCAVAMQKELAGNILDFRMGINLGDIIDDGEDIHGEGVNIAARLEGLAEPGGICISADVYSQIKNKLDLGYRSLGENRVKNVAEPIIAYLISPQSAKRPWSAMFNVDVSDERRKSEAMQPQMYRGDHSAFQQQVSDRLRLPAILLCLIVGLFGGHRFYLDRRKTAWLQLFTIGGLALWMLADLILLVTGDMKDGEGRRVKRWI